MYYERTLSPVIQNATETFPVVLISGPRQTGKTTLFEHALEPERKAGWDTPEVLANGAMNGAMLETYVVSELIKSYWHNGETAPLYFYRDRDQKEVDLVIEKHGTLYPIEIKRKTNPDLKDVKNFDALSSQENRLDSARSALPIRPWPCGMMWLSPP